MEKRVLLIVGGGIAAYKALELTRLLRKAGVGVRPILTAAGAQFVTPLSLGALAEDRVYADLFSLTDEAEMGHIELSRCGRDGRSRPCAPSSPTQTLRQQHSRRRPQPPR